jgi:hypothetical protein
MSKFWQVNEDPMYDDDGVLVDEDDWASAPIDVPELEEIDIPIHTD